MRTLVIACLLGGLTTAQAADLPSAPSPQKPEKAVCGLLPVSFEPVAPVKLSWQQRHKKAIIITGVVLGSAAGAGIAIATRRGTCPSVINGYAYDGTPPCPGPNYDPGPRKR